VLEVATLYSAPQIATMLGDLGADVVKVEPPAGDPLRGMGQQRSGRSVPWELVGRNKRSVVLDLDDAGGEDRATFRQLVAAADVLVENLPHEARARWGCAYEDLAGANPSVIVVSVSCYGRSGPYAERPGAGTLAEAFAGLTSMTGEADGPPMLASVAIGDTLTAFAGVIGALSACWSRDAHGGPGRLVDVSMYEPILAIMAATIAGWDGASAPPRRSGSRVPGGAPRNVYRTRDGRYVAVSGTTDPQVARLLELMGRTSAEDRARFARAADRLRSADELDDLVAAWVAERDRADVVDALLGARVGVSPVNDVADLLADPHVTARGSLVQGEVAVVPAALPAMSGARRDPRPAPALDADRAAVLEEWLA
jgi:formyl-CoA transferase